MKQWARNYTHCVQCGGTDYSHMAKGLCHSCYYKSYAAKHGSAIKTYKHKWYDKAGGALWARLQREQRNYGGLRVAVLERDGYKCVTCGSTKQLCVHHKDGKGRGHKAPLNVMTNLETLCRACHVRLHKPALKKGKKS